MIYYFSQYLLAKCISVSECKLICGDSFQNLPEVIQRTAKFLDVEINDRDVEILCQHLSFDEMKKNRSVNNEAIVSISNEKQRKIPFMRKGQVWRQTILDQRTLNSC